MLSVIMVKNQARGPTSFFGTPLHREELRGNDSSSSSFDRHYLVVGALPGIGGTQLIDDHKVTRTSLSQEQTHPTGTAGALGKVISAGLKQALPDEPPLRNPTRTGENPATGVGHELVQHVVFRHVVENLDEPGSRVALVADEEQPGVVLHPRRQGGQRSMVKSTPSL